VRTEEYSMWTVLRTATQMGGASLPLSQAVEDFIWAVACRLDEEDTQQIISFIQRSISPAQRIAEREPFLTLEEIEDGDYWENGR